MWPTNKQKESKAFVGWISLGKTLNKSSWEDECLASGLSAMLASVRTLPTACQEGTSSMTNFLTWEKSVVFVQTPGLKNSVRTSIFIRKETRKSTSSTHFYQPFHHPMARTWTKATSLSLRTRLYCAWCKLPPKCSSLNISVIKTKIKI